MKFTISLIVVTLVIAAFIMLRSSYSELSSFLPPLRNLDQDFIVPLGPHKPITFYESELPITLYFSTQTYDLEIIAHPDFFTQWQKFWVGRSWEISQRTITSAYPQLIETNIQGLTYRKYMDSSGDVSIFLTVKNNFQRVINKFYDAETQFVLLSKATKDLIVKEFPDAQHAQASVQPQSPNVIFLFEGAFGQQEDLGAGSGSLILLHELFQDDNSGLTDKNYMIHAIEKWATDEPALNAENVESYALLAHGFTQLISFENYFGDQCSWSHSWECLPGMPTERMYYEPLAVMTEDNSYGYGYLKTENTMNDNVYIGLKGLSLVPGYKGNAYIFRFQQQGCGASYAEIFNMQSGMPKQIRINLIYSPLISSITTKLDIPNAKGMFSLTVFGVSSLKREVRIGVSEFGAADYTRRPSTKSPKSSCLKVDQTTGEVTLVESYSATTFFMFGNIVEGALFYFIQSTNGSDMPIPVAGVANSYGKFMIPAKLTKDPSKWQLTIFTRPAESLKRDIYGIGQLVGGSESNQFYLENQSGGAPGFISLKSLSSLNSQERFQANKDKQAPTKLIKWELLDLRYMFIGSYLARLP